jgi:hypothetical protein
VDPVTATVFVNSCGKDVSLWQWNAAEGKLVEHPERGLGKERLGGFASDRALAIIPPGPGQNSGGHLLVAKSSHKELRVFSLPSLTLVHCVENCIPGQVLHGIAADPSGTSVAVCCVSARPGHRTADDAPMNSIRVLPWPLPGMTLL